MSATLDGSMLYPMLETPTNADAAAGLRRLRINPFDPASGRYTGETFYYPLEEQGKAIGDFSPITDDLHVVIERDHGQGSKAIFKKIYLVDFNVLDADNQLIKLELVDLMHLADPSDLDGDGSDVFTFPFVTIENVVAVDAYTLAVANDNNYPFSAGRAPAPIIDNSEFILIRFSTPLTEMEVKQ